MSGNAGSGAYVPPLVLYRCMKKVGSIARGGRTNFLFSLDEDGMYSAKLKSKTQDRPIPIGRGPKAHYSAPDFVLTKSEDCTYFRVMKGDTELGAVKFMKHRGESHAPKDIEAVWFGENGETVVSLTSKRPIKNADGQWCLDFEGRFACASIKNAILVDSQTQELMLMCRRLDEFEQNVDAKRQIPALFIFAVVLSLNIFPF
jgi:hypothetical protein